MRRPHSPWRSCERAQLSLRHPSSSFAPADECPHSRTGPGSASPRLRILLPQGEKGALLWLDPSYAIALIRSPGALLAHVHGRVWRVRLCYNAPLPSEGGLAMFRSLLALILTSLLAPHAPAGHSGAPLPALWYARG